MRKTLVLLNIFIGCFSHAQDSSAIKPVLKLCDSARFEYYNSRFHESIDLFKEAKELAEQKKLGEAFINTHVRQDIQMCYNALGDFKRAEEILNYLIEYAVKTGDKQMQINMRNDLGVTYSNAQEFEKSYNQFKSYLKLATSDEDKIDGFDGLAANAISLQKLSEAKQYLSEAQNLLEFGESRYKDEQWVFYYFNKANYFIASNQPKDAEPFFRNAVKHAEVLGSRKGANACISLASILLNKEQFTDAKSYLLKAKDFFRIGTSNHFKMDPYLVQINLGLAKIENQNDGSFEKAMDYIQETTDLVRFLKEKYLFSESKLFLNSQYRENLELGVSLLYKQFLKTNNQEFVIQAMVMADLARSSVLNERFVVSQKLKAVAVNDAQKSLRFKWLYQLNQSETNENHAEAMRYRNKLDSLDHHLGLKKQNEFTSASLKSIMSQLEPGQMILEYFIVGEDLYSFQIAENKISAIKQEINTAKDVVSFYQLLQNPSSSQVEFFTTGISIYNQLLKSQLNQYADISQLIIIPDRYLNFLPFDAIPISNQNTSWSSASYLGNNYTVSYHFSLQSLAQESADQPTSIYSGFAPNFEYNEVLSYIKGNDLVVNHAQELLGGHAYIGKSASSDLLWEGAANSAILQLYTHAVSNDISFDASYIYLDDKAMYVNEIMGLPLQTKLCILTACEVGLGKQYSGEGVTGVSWAYRAAGAENVVQSLWRINQESTKHIMESFFINLTKQKSSIVALQDAKTTYLNDPNLSERLKHPYYWAGINHYGTGTIITLKKNEKLKIALVVLLSGVLLFAGYRFIRKKRTA